MSMLVVQIIIITSAGANRSMVLLLSLFFLFLEARIKCSACQGTFILNKTQGSLNVLLLILGYDLPDNLKTTLSRLKFEDGSPRSLLLLVDKRVVYTLSLPLIQLLE